MNDTTYVGMRYVPVFAEPSQWDISRQYENLMMVTNEGETYISKEFVPTGVELTNEDYWVKISVPSGGEIDYSTTEQDTGLKWVDGKPIYQKTILYTNASVSLANLNIDEIVDIKGVSYLTDGTVFLLNTYNSEQYNTCIDITNGSLGITTAGWTFSKANVTIFYTKTTDTI